MHSSQNQVYFDHASTSPCDNRVVEQVRYFNEVAFGNPSSAHSLGETASRAIHSARIFFANLFGVSPQQVLFTSGATEANNLAIQGIALSQLIRKPGPQKGRAVFSGMEHVSVRKSMQSLQEFGFEVVSLPLTNRGKIEERSLKTLAEPPTFLMSLMTVNNITGGRVLIETLASQAKVIHPHLVFHTDAAQAFGKILLPRSPCAIDLLSISSNKMGGPKGVGALIVFNMDLIHNSRLRPLIWGGDQESGLRAGTPNTGLIAGFHLAAQLYLQDSEKSFQKVTRLRDTLKIQLETHGLLGRQVLWNSPEDALPHIVSLSVPGFPPASLVRILDEMGFCLSTGSACRSKKVESDPVLKAMGLPDWVTQHALRLSFSPQNTEEEVIRFVDCLKSSLLTLDKLQFSSGNAL